MVSETPLSGPISLLFDGINGVPLHGFNEVLCFMFFVAPRSGVATLTWSHELSLILFGWHYSKLSYEQIELKLGAFVQLTFIN